MTTFKKIASIVTELPKSTLPAGIGETQGSYPFFVSSAVVKRCNQFIFDGEAIVLSTGGNAAVNYGKGRFAYSTDCWALQPKQEEIHAIYLYQWLSNKQNQIDTLGFEGSGLRHLKKDYVRNLEINFPDLVKQTKIAEILSCIDTAIEQTEAMIAKQQRIKTGLMQDLLSKGIDEHGNIRTEQTHAFKDSELGRIPVEWGVSDAEFLCDAVIDCKNRTPPETKEGHPVIRTPNVRDGKFVWSDLLFTDENSYTIWTLRGKPRTGDVVITREAPFGESCLIPKELVNPCLGQRMMMYRPSADKIQNDYLVFAIYSERVQKRLFELAGGSTVGHIRVGDIRTLSISYPIKINEQIKISNALNGISDSLKKSSDELQKYTRLKTALMQDLLSGNVRVNQLIEN